MDYCPLNLQDATQDIRSSAECDHDVLGGWSKDVETQMRKIFGVRTKDVLKRMQKAVIFGSLNIARMYKVRMI